MKRNISVLLAVILLLSALASVPAGAGAAEDAIRAEIYGEESSYAPADADVFAKNVSKDVTVLRKLFV